MNIERCPNVFEKEKENGKKELKRKIGNYYDSFPKKREVGNPDANLAKKMTLFLVDKEYITGIGTWNSWGCKYENKMIFLNEQEMSKKAEDYYIFRLGRNRTGEYLFPNLREGIGGEVEKYRFLHEASHAYQDWLKDQDYPKNWFDRVLKESNEKKLSPLGRIFKFCYEKRSEQRYGLSTWGNVRDYEEWARECAERYLEDKDRNKENIEKAADYGLKCETAVRAWEDTNELSTMYLWHPEYLNTFLEYLSVNIDGYGSQHLKKDRLAEITEGEKEFLKENIAQYIEEMKENIR